MDYYMVLDFEMCMVKGAGRKKMRGMTQEIIQIGAVMVNEENHIVDDFSTFVKPEYGKLNEFITNLTGISDDDVKYAPCLWDALMIFVEWIGNRNVTALSWSDSDYFQLMREMRVKKIRNHTLQNLLDQWLDFQKSFDEMLGLHNQYSLEAAMKIGCIRPMGRMHDGLNDAYNTARLLTKIQRHPSFHLDFVPISEYSEEVEHLSYSMKELFTTEIMDQLQNLDTDNEDTTETALNVDNDKSSWSFYRRIMGWVNGKQAVSDENWNKYIFRKEMKRLDRRERIMNLFNVQEDVVADV